MGMGTGKGTGTGLDGDGVGRGGAGTETGTPGRVAGGPRGERFPKVAMVMEAGGGRESMGTPVAAQGRNAG